VADVTFGLFDWIDRGDAPLQRLYEERLRLVEAADAAGFVAYHLAEHHGTPLGMASSPGLFLAAAAQRTRRIRLGPLVYLLPLYDPLRLVEEICILDHLTGGRLEVGVGRGVSPYELAHFGVGEADARGMFDEALAVLVAGLTHERLTFGGRHFRYEDVPMELRPLQRPYPPLWYPSQNPESAARIGAQGYNFARLGPAAFARQPVIDYWRSWEAHRQDPDRLNGHVAAPRVGIVRQVLVAESDDEAAAVVPAAHAAWYRSIMKLWHEHDDHSHDHLFTWDSAIQHETIVYGSPARVREQLTRLLEVSGCNYVLCVFAWGTLPHEQAMRSLRLFADEVVPAFSANTPAVG